MNLLNWYVQIQSIKPEALTGKSQKQTPSQIIFICKNMETAWSYLTFNHVHWQEKKVVVLKVVFTNTDVSDIDQAKFFLKVN